MATTVTYKGQTLTTVDNQTKTLQTAGTWVEDDFTLTDVTQGGGGYTINQVIARTDLVGDVVDNTVTDLPVGCLSNSKITSFASTSVIKNTEGSAFKNCTNLVSVDMPNFEPTGTNVCGNMFAGCSSLTNIKLSKYRRSAGSFLQNCTSLPMIVLPSIDYTLQSYFANGCTSLTVVDLGGNVGGSIMAGNCFSHTAINTLILRRTAAINTLANTNNFNNSPLATNGTGGDIYVPSALLSAYQSASNWSALSATWHAIEGSQYENYYADGTPIE